MDYITKPVSRAALRKISSVIRGVFGCKSGNEPFPVLDALEKLPDVVPNTTYNVVEDCDLPKTVFAQCRQTFSGGFIIEIKRTVYDGAYRDKNTAFISFICHEICHVILFYLGFTPISERSISDNTRVERFRRVEWQAMALCGEVTIPYEATKGMSVREIIERYHVTEASAKYRVKYIK